MTDDPASEPVGAPPRVPTGIPGLDVILYGGLLRGSSYLVEGPSGTGKTVLVNQIVFHHAAAGGKVVYFSLFSESHAQLLHHLEGLEFFDRQLVGTAIQYLGGFRALEKDPGNLLDLIRQSLHATPATLLVVDGLLAVDERAGGTRFRTFLHELQVHTELVGCTTLLISPSAAHEFRPEHAAVDGTFVLSTSTFGRRAVRELRVLKFRGSPNLEGSHTFEISPRGIHLYPRMEALAGATEPEPPKWHRKLSTGVPQLDEMIGGGVVAGTSTVLLGATGTGKTVLGLHFLAAGAARGERGLYFGFYESPARLIGKAEGVGLPLGRHVENGLVRLVWQLPLEQLLDRLGEELLAQVREHRAERLLIDGLAGFQQTTALPSRISGFFTALANELRVLGVTTVLTAESSSLFGSGVADPLGGVSTVSENLLLLRYVELGTRVRRMIGVLKLRESDYDPTLRDLTITAKGIQLGGISEGMEGLLSGIPRVGRH